MTVSPNTFRNRTKKFVKKACSVKTVQKRFPILYWLPKYNLTTLIQDVIAGLTVGLTAIPQGLAYPVVAGLSPEYGLYAGLMGGFVYLFFGSCKDVTVGPTAIMSALVAKYVHGYSADFAVLAALLSGLVELVMGILNLGFLLNFISQSVINGFTTAAALQIASSQLKSLFGLTGSSGNYFAESIYNFFQNIHTARIWDSVIGFSTIGILILLKYLGQGCSRTDGTMKQIRWLISLARNAIVVITGIIIAYIMYILLDKEHLTLIGDIGSGLPKLTLPPFTSTVGNETYTFQDMIQVLGPQSIILPLIAILESVAIAKAFSGGAPVDATQEMIALGLCNVIGSFAKSMPVTGSFTRTALNNASGVQTPAGGIVTGLLIILALSLLTSTFYFIPKATLAALIITAMYSIIDYKILVMIWKNSKREFFVIFITIAVCLFVGLEYGIITGIALECLIVLYFASKPSINVYSVDNGNESIIVLSLLDKISYCAAEHIRRTILRVNKEANCKVIIIDGTNLKNIDTTAVTDIISVINDLSDKNVFFLNFNEDVKHVFLRREPNYSENFLMAERPVDVFKSLPKYV